MPGPKAVMVSSIMLESALTMHSNAGVCLSLWQVKAQGKGFVNPARSDVISLFYSTRKYIFMRPSVR
jgi:hypothetical protein